MRILLADDNPIFSGWLAQLLRDADLVVNVFADARQLQQALPGAGTVLVILGLPPEGEDHAALLSEVVQGRPCMVLASDDREAERIVALELGADDVVNKKAQPREIIARVNAVIRRIWRGTAGQGTGDGWQFIPARRELLRPDRTSIGLTAAEFTLLEHFVRNQGAALSREELFQVVFNRQFHPFDRAIDTLVAKLRKKLGESPRQARMILTVRPRGYAFQGFDDIQPGENENRAS